MKFPLVSATVLSMAATVTVTSVAPRSSLVMFLNSVTLSVVSFSCRSQTKIQRHTLAMLNKKTGKMVGTVI